MKKIMFNDKYGLTQAVLDGTKTMTRRIVKDGTPLGNWGETEKYAKYKIGEIVAVAQPYKDAFLPLDWLNRMIYEGEKGWGNKMFVRADLMPHHIRITDIKVEPLQDISEEDAYKEGIIPITWRQHLKQDWDDLSPQRVIDHHVYSLEIFRKGIEDAWAESDPNEYIAETPVIAFAVLIDKVSGKGTWKKNPWVFVYEFELVK